MHAADQPLLEANPLVAALPIDRPRLQGGFKKDACCLKWGSLLAQIRQERISQAKLEKRGGPRL